MCPLTTYSVQWGGCVFWLNIYRTDLYSIGNHFPPLLSDRQFIKPQGDHTWTVYFTFEGCICSSCLLHGVLGLTGLLISTMSQYLCVNNRSSSWGFTFVCLNSLKLESSSEPSTSASYSPSRYSKSNPSETNKRSQYQTKTTDTQQ